MADYIPPEKKKCFLTKIIVKNTNRNTNFKNQFIRNTQGVGVPEKYLKMGGHNKMTLREYGTILENGGVDNKMGGGSNDFRISAFNGFDVFSIRKNVRK